ncbi:SAM-dependent methyltransferase [Saccharopolyspora sp. CA-218241]|uniref:SAM-dependent methyltransferase n=1 Tax=Saccharopolyspora sp. CA-218241 TaxID=3240027 RepID=UPI003D98DB3D
MSGWACGSGIDLDTPNVARVYDYYLGGAHNFQVDRRFAEKAIAMFPATRELARRNRAFLQRAVRELAGLGCEQFLDLGSGIPTAGHVHEIARRTAPRARVAYVDNEPVAVEHSRMLVGDVDGVVAVRADFTRPDEVLGHPEVRSVLDFDEPIAVLFCAALHLVPDEDDPYGLVARYRDATAPGSYLAVSHGTLDNRPDIAALVRHYARGVSNRFIVRDRAECARFFAGYDLLDPGVVFTAQWRPDEDPSQNEEAERSGVYAGVGRKP